MSANASDVIKTLRSLLNSTQNGLNANQLMREFREMEGYAVPFQQLGFSTFVQFLQNSNEFEIQNTPNGPHIRAKLTKESVHIAKLVSSQNRGKRKKNVKPIPFAPRRNVQSNNNWRNTAFAKVSVIWCQTSTVIASGLFGGKIYADDFDEFNIFLGRKYVS